MKISQSFTQLSKGKESTLIITVDYDPHEGVENVISVEVLNAKGLIDVTSIFNDQFPDQLWEMVDLQDWHQVYIESQPEPDHEPQEKATVNDLYQYDSSAGVRGLMQNINSILFGK